MATSNKRPIAVLNIKQLKRINDFISKMRGVSLNMANNVALFPTPNPTLATFNTNIDTLEAAEAQTQTRTRGSVESRNQAYDLVLDNVHNLLNYVQDLADNSADVDDAINLIARSGFDLKAKGSINKPDLEARTGIVSGSVELIAKAMKTRGAYEWQMSPDQTTWTNLPTTLQARQLITGLTPGSKVYFRLRMVDKDGEGQWSQVVTTLIN